ncbi:MAG TPA: hypothetical protein VIL22_05100 [Paenibacillaceae bacterium]
MLNDEIHSIRDGSRFRIYRVPARALKPDEEWATPFDLRNITKDQLAKVEIVYLYQDAGGEGTRGFVEGGAKGIVTAGTGAGGISAAMREEFSRVPRAYAGAISGMDCTACVGSRAAVCLVFTRQFGRGSV